MFDAFRQRHPRLDRWDRMMGEFVLAVFCTGFEVMLIGELFGASKQAQGIAFVLLLAATVALIIWSDRRGPPRKPPYTM